MVEAMAAGLPVVATPRAAIPDMVKDGETGFLVPEGSPAELAAALSHAAATRGRFQLIEIMLPRGAISPTLQRFVRAVKRLSMPA